MLQLLYKPRMKAAFSVPRHNCGNTSDMAGSCLFSDAELGRSLAGGIPERSVLQPPVSLSQSVIWDLMAAFYAREGRNAWRVNTVPSFITSNTFIARGHARQALAFWADCASAGKLNCDMTVPLYEVVSEASRVISRDPTDAWKRVVDFGRYFVEVGSGSGKCAFHLALAFRELVQANGPQVRALEGRRIVVVLSDFCRSNVDAWGSHEQLKGLAEEGRIDWAQFDAQGELLSRAKAGATEGNHDDAPAAPAALTLEVSGTILSEGHPANPMCFACNYVFDTLRHDAFQILDGRLFEVRVSAGSERVPEPDPKDPSILERLHNVWSNAPATPTPFYGGVARHAKAANSTLEWYTRFFSRTSGSDKHHLTPTSPRHVIVAEDGAASPTDASNDDDTSDSGDWEESNAAASFLLPIGGFCCIERCLRIASGSMLLLVGDKGSTSVEAFQGIGDPHIAVHGSFSMMVNLHAVGIFVSLLGGCALQSAREDCHFHVSSFVFDGSTSAATMAVPPARMLHREGADCHPFQSWGWCESQGFPGATMALEATFPHLRDAFSEHVDRFGPYDFYRLHQSIVVRRPLCCGRHWSYSVVWFADCMTCLRWHAPLPSPKLQLYFTSAAGTLMLCGCCERKSSHRCGLSWCYMFSCSHCTCVAFQPCPHVQLPKCGRKKRADWTHGLKRAWLHHFRLDADRDIAFELGRFYFALRRFVFWACSVGLLDFWKLNPMVVQCCAPGSRTRFSFTTYLKSE